MKKLLMTLLSLALVATIAVSGTVAYFTDTEAAVNVMTVGSIKIDQHEQDRNGNDFKQGDFILPIVQGANVKDDNGYPADPNYVDKIVTVENTGANDAYVRTFVAIPDYNYEGKDANNASANVLHWNGYSKGDAAPNYPAATRLPGTETDVANQWSWGKTSSDVWPGNGGDWNTFTATIDNIPHTVYVITHTTAVKPGEITAPNMVGIYLDSMVDYDHDLGVYTINGKTINGMDGTVKVYVGTQAVQADGNWASLDAAGRGVAFAALDTAFGNPQEKGQEMVEKLFGKVTPAATASDAKGMQNALTNGNDKVVVMTDDVELTEPHTTITSPKTIDLSGSTLSAARSNGGGADTYSVLTVNDVVTITGNGTVENTVGYAISLRDDAAKLTIENGTFKGGTTAINVVKGDLIIKGGFFEDINAEENGHYLINCIDANYNDGSATVTIMGGTFVNWNPANNTSEGAGTNFLAKGYHVVEVKYDADTTHYTVVPGEAPVENWYDPAAKELIVDSVSDMYAFAATVNNGIDSFYQKTIKLGADIDLANAIWTPIGQTGNKEFKGVFDGQSYTIRNFIVNNTDEGPNCSSGLFGWVESHGEGIAIQNFNVENAQVTGHHYTGVVVGYLYGTVKNVNVSNSSVNCTNVNNDANGDKAGVIVGYLGESSTINNCTATDCFVSAGRDAGQIVGAARPARVTNCTATRVSVSANGTGTGANIRNELVGRPLN